MKKIWVIVCAFVCIEMSQVTWGGAQVVCPNTNLAEDALDCPWAAVSREMQLATSTAEKKKIFSKKLKRLYKDIQSEASRSEVKDLWGQSLNFDAYAKTQIAEPEILDLIFELSKAPKRNEKVVHAGLEHTYGYLFSTIQTPFGYKRARWVKDDIEKGFDLPRGTLGPNPEKGTLFLNVSYFAAKLLKMNLAPFSKSLKIIPASLKNFDSNLLKSRKLVETVELDAGKRKVELVTEIFEFAVKPAEAKANSALLVHWVKDSGVSKIITLFPVSADFASGLFQEKNLGKDQLITTKYNAFVAGITDSKEPIKGQRKEETTSSNR